MKQYIIAHADKTVLRITGLRVKGLNAVQLEGLLSDRLKSQVRVIGVTGDGIDMDLYGVSPDMISRDEKGLIDAIALAEGIALTDLAKVVCNEKIRDADFASIPEAPPSSCARERWIERG